MSECLDPKKFAERVAEMKRTLGSSRAVGEKLGVKYQTIDRWLRDADKGTLDVGGISLRTYLSVMGQYDILRPCVPTAAHPAEPLDEFDRALAGHMAVVREILEAREPVITEALTTNLAAFRLSIHALRNARHASPTSHTRKRVA